MGQFLITFTKKAESEPKLPYNYENITKHADSPLNNFSTTKELYDHLYSGVFLEQKRKKFWIDKKSRSNCFMIYARDLSISWSDDKRFWNWSCLKEINDDGVEVAELLDVCWLEVHGKFDISRLSPKTRYIILFVIMVNDLADEWDGSLNIELILPNGKSKQHKEALLGKARAKWIELKVGELYVSPNEMGEVQFSMNEYGAIRKKGLKLKGVIIRPKNHVLF